MTRTNQAGVFTINDNNVRKALQFKYPELVLLIKNEVYYETASHINAT